jgi:hypothetical protein
MVGMAKFRVALSAENELRGPMPMESSPGIWVYEIEAPDIGAAFSHAEDQWREEHHVLPGDGPLRYGVAHRL